VKEKIEAMITLGQRYFEEQKEETKPEVPTVEAYFERFKSTYMETAVRASTRNRYETSFRVHILPKLGKKHLNELNREMMEDFISILSRKRLAKDSIRLVLAPLRLLFNRARAAGIIQDNPATGLSEFYKQAPTLHEEIEPLTREEVPLFLQSVSKHSAEPFALFLCAIHTGLRSGELSAHFNGATWISTASSLPSAGM